LHQFGEPDVYAGGAVTRFSLGPIGMKICLVGFGEVGIAAIVRMESRAYKSPAYEGRGNWFK
jgi:hypothetical protein